MAECQNQGTCAFHKERDAMIQEIKSEINDNIGPTINQHKAYWRFFFWFAGIALSIMTGLTYSMHGTSVEIAKSVDKLERTVGQQEIINNYITTKLNENKAEITVCRGRIRAVEGKIH